MCNHKDIDQTEIYPARTINSQPSAENKKQLNHPSKRHQRARLQCHSVTALSYHKAGSSDAEGNEKH